MTAKQFTESITRALAAHDMEAAVAILRVRAVHHPREAQDVLDTLNVGIWLSKAEATS